MHPGDKSEKDPILNPGEKSYLETIEILKAQLCDLQSSVNIHFEKIEKEFTQKIRDKHTQLSEEIKEMGKKDGQPDLMSTDFKDRQIYSILNSFFTELFLNLSLPGMRYVSKKEPTPYRLVWVFIHLSALLISFSYIQDAHNSWQSSPVVLSLTYTKIEDIPFPAVTVCEPLKLKDDYKQIEILERCVSLENIRKWICSREELKIFLISADLNPLSFTDGNPPLSLNNDTGSFNNSVDYTELCLGMQGDGTEECFQAEWNGLFHGNEYLEYIYKLIEEVELNGFNIVPSDVDYYYTGQTVLMKPVVGANIMMCQTFNDIKDQMRFQWYETNDNNTYFKNNSQHHGLKTTSNCEPDKIFDGYCKNDSIYSNGLFIEFDNYDDDDNDESLYYVIFHNPADYPRSTSMYDTNFFFTVKQSGESYDFTVTPKFVDANRDLKEIEVSKRNCVFASEKKLSQSSYYTHQNCILECQINCSLTTCGCIPLQIVILNSYQNASYQNVCSTKKSQECESITNIQGNYKHYKCPCDCPLDCISLTYDIISTVKNRDPIQNRTQPTILNIRYDEPEFISSYRYSLISTGEFLAYSLGILGVFNGFSLIMVWEILYWVTFRLWYNIGRNREFNVMKMQIY